MHPPLAAIASGDGGVYCGGGLYSGDSGILRPMALCDSDKTDNLLFALGQAGAVFGGLMFGYTLFGVEFLLLVLSLAVLASTKNVHISKLVAESIGAGIVGTNCAKPSFSPVDKKAVVVVAENCALCLLNYWIVGVSIHFLNLKTVYGMKQIIN